MLCACRVKLGSRSNFPPTLGKTLVAAKHDDFNHTIGEIIISPRTHENVGGLPYASLMNYTHSSDLRTIQEIFHVGPFLGDAADALDLSDLFDQGTIPKKP